MHSREPRRDNLTSASSASAAVNTAQTSVVIPAFNEEASIAAVLRDLQDSAAWHELLVIDDGSTDETGARAASAGARVIRHPYTLGNGAAERQ